MVQSSWNNREAQVTVHVASYTEPDGVGSLTYLASPRIKFTEGDTEYSTDAVLKLLPGPNGIRSADLCVEQVSTSTAGSTPLSFRRPKP